MRLLAVIIITCLAGIFTDARAESVSSVEPVNYTDPSCKQLPACSEVQLTQLSEKINAKRQEGVYCGGRFRKPMLALSENKNLKKSAFQHTEDMAKHNFFGHKGSNNSKSQDRVSDAGYRWQAVTENIAAGQRCIDNVLQSWLASVSHCENLMSRKYSEMGLACSVNSQSEYGIYWNAVLASPQ